MNYERIKQLSGITLTEAKGEYSDSAEFTDELADVGSYVLKIEKILKQKRWKDWMSITDENFSTRVVAQNNTVMAKFKEFKKEMDLLEKQLTEAE